jgi:hypothetical protein
MFVILSFSVVSAIFENVRTKDRNDGGLTKENSDDWTLGRMWKGEGDEWYIRGTLSDFLKT